jgi:LuxR family maltose regulon positive regulatory protein
VLTWKEGQYVLVLDDLHNINNEEILKSLPFVLKRLPPFVTVLFLSRAALPDAMFPMTENDKVEFIGADELAFTPEEIRNHFINHGWFVSAERAADIRAFTDGWVIILNAMALSGSQKLSYENQKPTLEDYFEKNIWAGFDEETQEFIMKTSIVDSFTAELCEKLTENPDSAAILDKLVKGNINLSRVGQEYRYHILFLDFLRDRLCGSGIDQKALIASAANYYLGMGDFFRAAVLSMRQDKGKLIMQVVQTFFQSKNPTLEQMLELSQVYDTSKLPKELYGQQPILFMPVILAAFFRGETDTLKTFFDRFYAALPAFFHTAPSIGWIVPTHLLFDYRKNLTETIAYMDSIGMKREREIPGQAAIITVQSPAPHRGVKEFCEFLDGGVKDAVHELFSIMLPGDSECFLRGVTAGLLLEQNRLEEAFEKAIGAFDALTDSTSYEVTFCISVLLAEIYALRLDKERSQTALKRLRLWIDDSRAFYLLKNLEAFEKRLQMWDGSTAAANEWLENYFVNDISFGEFYKTYQNLTTARAYIMLSMNGEATSALSQIKALGAEMNRPLDAAEADILLSILEWVSGKKKESRDRLHGVLAKMQTFGFVRVIANEGKSVLPILASVLKKLDKETEKDESLYRFTKEIQVAAYEQSKHFRGLTSGLRHKPVKLSPKQTLMLELLSKGHKNNEIVEMTGLSINTIREHSRVAYRKLDVTNAMDAIVKARQLGLLK